MIKVPCGTCDNSGTVHTRCEKYSEYRSKLDERNKLIAENKQKESMLLGLFADCVAKSNRKKNGQR